MATNNDNNDKNKKKRSGRSYSEKQQKAIQDSIRAIKDYYGDQATPQLINSIIANIDIETGFNDLRENSYRWETIRKSPGQMKSINAMLDKWGKGKEAYDKLSNDEKLSVMYWGDTNHTATAGGSGALQLTSAGYGGNDKTDRDLHKAVDELGLDINTVNDNFYDSTLATLKVFENRGKPFHEYGSSPKELRSKVINPGERLSSENEKHAHKIETLNYFDAGDFALSDQIDLDNLYNDELTERDKVILKGTSSVNPEVIASNPNLDDGQKEELIKMSESEGLEPSTAEQVQYRPSILHELGAPTGYQGKILNQEIVNKDAEQKQQKLNKENAKRAGHLQEINSFSKDFNLLDKNFDKGGNLDSGCGGPGQPPCDDKVRANKMNVLDEVLVNFKSNNKNPRIVASKNAPRYQAYNDSLAAYNGINTVVQKKRENFEEYADTYEDMYKRIISDTTGTYTDTEKEEAKWSIQGLNQRRNNNQKGQYFSRSNYEKTARERAQKKDGNYKIPDDLSYYEGNSTEYGYHYNSDDNSYKKGHPTMLTNYTLQALQKGIKPRYLINENEGLGVGIFDKPKEKIFIEGTPEAEVAKKQMLLQKRGTYDGPIDGIWGKGSQEALNNTDFKSKEGRNKYQDINFGKYKDYFEVQGMHDMDPSTTTIRMTKNNPHNASTVRPILEKLRALNPGKKFNLSNSFAKGGVLSTTDPVDPPGKKKSPGLLDWYHNGPEIRASYEMANKYDNGWISKWINSKGAKNRLSKYSSNPDKITEYGNNALSNLPVLFVDKMKGLSNDDYAYNHKLQGFKETNKANLNYDALRDTYGNVGGMYLPDAHVAGIKDRKQTSYAAHEVAHGMKEYDDFNEAFIRDKFGDRLKDKEAYVDEYSPTSKARPNTRSHYEYMDKDGIYPRVMEARRRAKISPDQKVDMEFIENHYNELGDLKRLFDKETIVEILNSVASNNKIINKNNVAAYGGFINPTKDVNEKYASNNTQYNQGGLLQQEQSNMLTEYNEGGSHEQNPQGGIPVGQNAQGGKNLVEQGETRHEDYIYSNEVKLSKDQAERFNIHPKYIGKNFSDISRQINDMIKDRPNDKIEKKTAKGNLNKLMLAQEAIKEEELKKDAVRNLTPEELAEAEHHGMDPYDYVIQKGMREQQSQGDQQFMFGGMMNGGINSQAAQMGMNVGGQIGEGMQVNNPNTTIPAWEQTKDAAAQTNPWMAAARAGEQLTKGIGATVAGQKGENVATGIADPFSSQVGVLKHEDATGWEKAASVAVPVLSGFMMNKAENRAQAKQHRKESYIDNNQHVSTFKKGGLLDTEFHSGGNIQPHMHPHTPGQSGSFPTELSTGQQEINNYQFGMDRPLPFGLNKPSFNQADYKINPEYSNPTTRDVRTANEVPQYPKPEARLGLQGNTSWDAAQELQLTQTGAPQAADFGNRPILDGNRSFIDTDNPAPARKKDVDGDYYFNNPDGLLNGASQNKLKEHEAHASELDAYVPSAKDGVFLNEQIRKNHEAYVQGLENQEVAPQLLSMEDIIGSSNDDESDSNSNSKYGAKKNNFKAGELLRYASTAGNIAQLLSMGDPEVESYDRLLNRFRPEQMDERALENRAATTGANVRNALQNTYGGSQAAARAGLLASHSNQNKGLSDAMMQAQQFNMQQNNIAQQQNMRLDGMNQQIDMQEKIANSQNRAAHETKREDLINQTLGDLTSMGKEESLKARIENLSGYDSKGNKIPLSEIYKSAEDKNKIVQMLAKAVGLS